jgi:hypothetical protein
MLFRPFAASTLAVGAGLWIYQSNVNFLANSSLWVLACMGIIGILYAVLACLFGAIEREDILSLPMGNCLERILRFFHLLKKIE